jgi:hypothetical protein
MNATPAALFPAASIPTTSTAARLYAASLASRNCR